MIGRSFVPPAWIYEPRFFDRNDIGLPAGQRMIHDDSALAKYSFKPESSHLPDDRLLLARFPLSQQDKFHPRPVR